MSTLRVRSCSPEAKEDPRASSVKHTPQCALLWIAAEGEAKPPVGTIATPAEAGSGPFRSMALVACCIWVLQEELALISILRSLMPILMKRLCAGLSSFSTH